MLAVGIRQERTRQHQKSPLRSNVIPVQSPVSAQRQLRAPWLAKPAWLYISSFHKATGEVLDRTGNHFLTKKHHQHLKKPRYSFLCIYLCSLVPAADRGVLESPGFSFNATCYLGSNQGTDRPLSPRRVQKPNVNFSSPGNAPSFTIL